MSASMPWIKLYTEMLDDPKIGKLSEATKWRFVQLLLLAGESDSDGYLTNGDMALSVEEIAWRLRIDETQLIEDVTRLSRLGLLEVDDGMLCIRNFAKRQGRSQEDKRAAWRARQSKKRSGGSDIGGTPPTPIEPVTPTPPSESQTEPESVTRESRVSHASRVEERRGDIEKSREEEEKSLGADAQPAKTNLPPNVWAKSLKKPKTAKPKAEPDPRSKHPAILAVREITGRYPNKAVYDVLIQALGESPDKDKATLCFQTWVARGYKEFAITPFTEWYRDGCPEPYKAAVSRANGNPAPLKGHEKSAANIDAAFERIRAMRGESE